MGNQVNGYKVFEFVSYDEGGDSPGTPKFYNFSEHYQAFVEKDSAQASRHVYDDGSKGKYHHFINLTLICDFSGAMEKPDGLLVQELKNDEIDGRTLYLMPHTDNEITRDRIIKVQIVENERTLDKHYGDQANKGYILTLENVDPILKYNWIDPGDTIDIGGTTHVKLHPIIAKTN